MLVRQLPMKWLSIPCLCCFGRVSAPVCSSIFALLAITARSWVEGNKEKKRNEQKMEISTESVGAGKRGKNRSDCGHFSERKQAEKWWEWKTVKWRNAVEGSSSGSSNSSATVQQSFLFLFSYYNAHLQRKALLMQQSLGYGKRKNERNL